MSASGKTKPVHADGCYTVEQIAELLQTSRNRVYDLIYAGKLKGISLLTDRENGEPGRRNLWRVPVCAYKEFLTGQGIDAGLGG